MAKSGWTKNTYEVLTSKGKRWIIDATFENKAKALSRAESLMSTGEGVRVTEAREGWSQERVIFEEAGTEREKPLKFVPIPDVVLCETSMDVYRFPARRDIARILRAYLDKHGLTALELLFNSAHLRMLERMDTYYPAAMQHAAQMQSKLTDASKTDCVDALYKSFARVIKRARNGEGDDADVLEKHGIDVALAEIDKAHQGDKAELAALAMLAGHIAGGDWRHKVSVLIELADSTTDERALNLIDGALAECLDGGEALRDIFGVPANAVEAWRNLILVSTGNFVAKRVASEEMRRLNDVFAHRHLPLAQKILLERVATGLGGIKPLSREGRDADREDFVGLVRELVEPAGLAGGPPMSEAVVLRAKSLLGEGGEDLPIETAIRQALYLMPSQATRIGVLLDLTGSDLGRKHETAVRGQFAQLLTQLKSIYDLFPSDVIGEDRVKCIEALRDKLGMSGLSKELKDAFAASLSTVTSEAKSTPKPSPEPVEKRTRERVVKKSGTLALSPGDVVFEQGEAGQEAYLITEGSVAIYRTVGGKDKLLATVGRGEVIGEMSLIDNQPRMASARAVEASELMVLSQDDLTDRMSKLQSNDKVLHFLIRTLVRRLRGVARISE